MNSKPNIQRTRQHYQSQNKTNKNLAATNRNNEHAATADPTQKHSSRKHQQLAKTKNRNTPPTPATNKYLST
jgi:hypothetical protein